MDIRNGGAALKRRRLADEMTIEEVLRGMERLGIKMETSDISRLENGRVTSPSLEKATTYGTFLGMTPNDIARAYGLWTGPEGVDDRLGRVAMALNNLPETDRERLIVAIEQLVQS